MAVFQTAKLRRGVQMFRATRPSTDNRQITTILQQVLSSERPINPPTRSALLTANWRSCEDVRLFRSAYFRASNENWTI
jgi:hypothetical protein